MKYLILLTLFCTGAVFADCTTKEASQMIKEVETSPITNLTKTVKDQSCRVKYNITVDGKEHTVDYTYNKDANCSEAIERGKNELLVSLAGRYKTEVVTTCGKEMADKPVRVGDIVFENELLSVERQQGYFKHNNSKCRLFRERYVQKGTLRVVHGVICQVNQNDWIVVDKW